VVIRDSCDKEDQQHFVCVLLNDSETLRRYEHETLIENLQPPSHVFKTIGGHQGGI